MLSLSSYSGTDWMLHSCTNRFFFSFALRSLHVFCFLGLSLCSYSDCFEYMNNALYGARSGIWCYLHFFSLHLMPSYRLSLFHVCVLRILIINILLGNSYKANTLNTVNGLWMKKKDMNIIYYTCSIWSCIASVQANHFLFAVRI